MKELPKDKNKLVSNLPGVVVPINEVLQLKISDKISDFVSVWDEENSKGILNSFQYLSAVELAPPIGLKSYYCLLFAKESPVGLFLFQVKDFDLRKALNIHTHDEGFLAKLWVGIKNAAITRVRHDLLIVGNVLLTGQYGINFCAKLSIEEKLNYLNLSVEAFANHMNANKTHNIKSILLKDFEVGEDSNVHLPEYMQFTIDPFMYIDIRWGSLDDYLAALKSKYRVRYKRALKKGSLLEFAEMDLEALRENKEKMFSLYKQISTNVSFNLFDLNQDYFVKLKESMGDDIIIKSVKINNEFIAFYSLIIDKDHNELDAHFLGYDMSRNQANQTYQNILYSILEDSINLKVSKVNLSRTAMEIKSSVGAVGKTLFLLLKHRNKAVNWLLRRFLNSYVPDNSWQPRQPFKE